MTAPRKPLPEPPIDQVIRLLAQAAGIAQRKRMGSMVRTHIAIALMHAFDKAEMLRARKLRG